MPGEWRKAAVAGVLVGAVFSAILIGGCAREVTPPALTSAPVTGEPAEDSTLTIAIAGMVTPDEGLDYYLGLSEYIGRRVGRPVRLIHKADYSQVNEMLEQGKVDVAFVCSGPYTIGHDSYGLELIAAPVVNGRPAYCAYIIVPSSSEATSLASLRGGVFAFTDPESNTGHTVPKFMLASAGDTPEDFFAETYYTYSHDNSIRAVAEGKADGAAVDSLIWDYQDATDPAFTSRTRIVERSETFAIPPVVARPGLDDALVDAVRDVLLGAHEDAEGARLLEQMKIERFVEIEDSAYDSIRRMNQRLAE